MKNSDEVYNEIKELFQNSPPVPEKLSKENVVKILENTKQEKVSKISLGKKMAIAASFAVVLLCLGVSLNGASLEFSPKEADDVTVQDTVQSVTENETTLQTETTQAIPQDKKEENTSSLRKAESRSELEELVLKIVQRNIYYSSTYTVNGEIADGVTLAASAVNESAKDNVSSESYGETNIQVQGVDEGDIIKNDGRYIYTLGRDKSGFTKLRIVDSESKSLVYNGYVFDDMGEIVTISEMYLYENTLVVMGVTGTVYEGYNEMASKGFRTYRLSGKNDTVIALYDITDKSSPKLIKVNKQSGSYQSSRMVGGVLYTLTDYYVSGSDEEEIKKGCVPQVNGMEITCDCIYIMDENSNQYICLSALDVENGGNEMNSLAVLGGGETVYCSENNFYVVNMRYYNLGETDFNGGINGVSTINVFTLNGTEISLSASGEVPGRVINQYSMDEYKGYLRVASYYFNYKTNRSESSLYVFDETMKIVGKLEDIAKDEEIKSVRFKGDTAYLVTYRNTDPFFVIDLSDPQNPAFDGELKIPGFSTYLYDVSDSLIIGVGYGGDSDSADMSKVKVSLFDVSDRNNPKEVDSIIIKDSYTLANDDAKFFLYNRNENYIALPVYSFSSSYETELRYYIIDVKSEGLETRHIFEHSSSGAEYYFRGTYIGNTFYSFSDYLANAFDLTTGENVWECPYYDASQIKQEEIMITEEFEIAEETTKSGLWTLFSKEETTEDNNLTEQTTQVYDGVVVVETTAQ